MKTTLFLSVLLICGGLLAQAALPLTESTFTEIVQEVNVVAATSKAVTPARTNELFRAPDLVRTGPLSRVELTAKDLTITRIGANTVFTFEPGSRDIQLKQGSVLFHSPVGAGGGAIKNRGSSAAVLGTTLIGAIISNNRFKILDLEGRVKVTLINGLFVFLNPGQMVIISADRNSMGELMNFNLGELASRLQLVMGFSHPLSSWGLIEAAAQQQYREIAAGHIGHLISLEIASFGLDMRYRGLNDLPYYSYNPLDDGNPLDFPGSGSVYPFSFGPGSFELFVPNVYQGGFFEIINPPPATIANPP